MSYPNDQGNAASAIPVYTVSNAAAMKTGVSSNSTVGTTSAVLVPASTYKSWVTIQNTSASNTLRISFTNPATATDFGIGPGGAMTLPFGVSNAIYGLGSAAGTTYALIGA